MRGLLLAVILCFCSVKAVRIGPNGEILYAVTPAKSEEVMSIVAQVQGTRPKPMPTEVAVPFDSIPIDDPERKEGPMEDNEITTHNLIQLVLKALDKQDNKDRDARIKIQGDGILAWRQSLMSSRPINSSRKSKQEEERTSKEYTSDSAHEATETHNETRLELKSEQSSKAWTTKFKEHKLALLIKKGISIYNKIYNAMLLKPDGKEHFFKQWLSDEELKHRKLYRGKFHPIKIMPKPKEEKRSVGHDWDHVNAHSPPDIQTVEGNQHYRRAKWNNCTEDHDYVHGCSTSHDLQKYISVVKDDNEFRDDLRELFAKLRKGDRMMQSPRHECKERGDAKLCLSWSWPCDLGWSLYHVEKMIKDIMRCRADDTAFPSGQFKWQDLHEEKKNWRTVCVSDREKGCAKDEWFCPDMNSGRETYKQRDARKKFKAEFGYLPQPDHNHPSPDGKYY